MCTKAKFQSILWIIDDADVCECSCLSDAPTIIVKTPELSQERGKSAVLECTVMGFPRGQNYWRKDGNVLIRDWNYDPQDIQQNSTTTVMNLLIKQVEPPQGYGVYYCVAENQHGEVTGNVTLHGEHWTRFGFIIQCCIIQYIILLKLLNWVLYIQYCECVIHLNDKKEWCMELYCWHLFRVKQFFSNHEHDFGNN